MKKQRKNSKKIVQNIFAGELGLGLFQEDVINGFASLQIGIKRQVITYEELFSRLYGF